MRPNDYRKRLGRFRTESQLKLVPACAAVHGPWLDIGYLIAFGELVIQLELSLLCLAGRKVHPELDQVSDALEPFVFYGK